jgi:Flp pilus assembly protein CpaB
MGRRWSRASRAYALASLVCAALAGASVHAYLGRAAEASGLAGPPVRVVVAASAVTRGTAIRADQLRVESIPRAYAPPGALERISQAAGRVALAALASGEVVTETRLARVRAGPVASLTPEGLRAFAVPTSQPRGAVAPGDHVDVLATYGSGAPHTETAASGLEVLLVLGPAPGGSGGLTGLGTGATGSASQATLMLLVSPDQEERLAYAAAFASLSIAVAPPTSTSTPGE